MPHPRTALHLCRGVVFTLKGFAAHIEAYIPYLEHTHVFTPIEVHLLDFGARTLESVAKNGSVLEGVSGCIGFLRYPFAFLRADSAFGHFFCDPP